MPGGKQEVEKGQQGARRPGWLVGESGVAYRVV